MKRSATDVHRSRGARNTQAAKVKSSHEDVTLGLIALGTHEQALDQVWHISTAQALTVRQYIALASCAAGVQARALAVQGLLQSRLGLTNAVPHESVELLYAFNEPFLIDGSK